MDDPIARAYSDQTGEGTLPFFIGKQYGTGWLHSLARFAFPIVKKVVGMAGNVAANTAEDLLENRKSFGESIKDNAMNELGRSFKRKRPSSSASSSINRGVGKSKRGKLIQRRNTIFK